MLDILDLSPYAYAALAFIAVLVGALVPRRFSLLTLILGGVLLVIGCSGFLYVFRGGKVPQLTVEEAGKYLGRTALFGAGILAGALARYSFAAFFSRLQALSRIPPGRSPAPDQPRPKNDLIEGVAFACLLSVLCGVVLVKRPMDAAILCWLIYAIACGVSISLPPRARQLTSEGIKNVIVVSLPPAVLLFLIILFEFLAPSLFGIGVISVISPDPNDPQSTARAAADGWKIFWLYLLIGGLSAVAIAIAVFARARVVSLVTQLFALDPDRFSRVEKVINTAIRIGAAIGGIFLAART